MGEDRATMRTKFIHLGSFGWCWRMLGWIQCPRSGGGRLRFVILVAWLACLACLGVCSADDSAEIRVWRDQTGRFETKAILVEIRDGRVKLRKPDGRVVWPPLSLLSQPDQDYVAKWQQAQKASDIFAGGVMEGDSPGPEAEATATAWKPGDEPVSVQSGRLLTVQPMPRPKLSEADPRSVSMSSPQAGLTVLPTIAGLADGNIPYLLDPKGRLSLLRVQQGTWDKTKFSQAVLVDHEVNRANPTTRWEEPLHFFNANPNHGLILGRADVGSWGATGQMVMLRLDGSGQLSELLRWYPDPESKESKPRVRQVEFIDAEIVLARVGDIVRVYDWNERREIWRLPISGWHRPALSPGGRYFAAQIRDEIALFESKTGNQLGVIKRDDADPVDLVFHPTGLRLAAVGGREIDIYDLADAGNDRSFSLTEPIDTFYSDPSWTDESHLLVGGTRLVDTDLGRQVWQYDLGGRGNDNRAFQSGLFRGVIGGRGGLIVFRHAIPHATVAKAKASVDWSDIQVLGPGDSVRLEISVSGPTNRSKVAELMQAAIAKAGWKLSDTADSVVRFANYRTDERTHRFRSGPLKDQELPYRPYATVVDVEVGGEVVYRVADVGRVPDDFKVSLDETLKDAIERQTVPTYRMIERLDLPPHIIQPEFQHGLGKSTLDAEGFVDATDFVSGLVQAPPRGR
ncbi:hypothetical protein V7x_12540 [Crateriforma conspicua]|uniref:SLA1 homology domain-containing protein n=2 Tax=Planctomycetaceae TaxID=126 RepID=A0A5C6FVQ2_9PLAN|nr:hypothetical protein V7x_12540 [Crateriforma conspicua]